MRVVLASGIPHWAWALVPFVAIVIARATRAGRLRSARRRDTTTYGPGGTFASPPGGGSEPDKGSSDSGDGAS